MQKIVFLFMLFQLAFSPVRSQQLQPGDDCRALIGEETWQYSGQPLRMADYQGKWVVLDFWNHSCITCVQAFAPMEALQKEFADQLQVVLVSKESRDSTIRFFKKRKKIEVPPFPFITSAIDLWHRFNPDHSPFHAWINPQGQLCYVTGPHNLTVGHFREVLAGKKPYMASVVPVAKPVVQTGFSFEGLRAGYQSRILPCGEGSIERNVEAERMGNGQFIRMSKACSSVEGLLLKAFEEYDKYRFSSPAQVLWMLDDTTKYVLPADPGERDAWKQGHSYSYELVIPVEQQSTRYAYMQEDVQRYFGLTAVVEKRELTCMSLVRTGDTRLLLPETAEVGDNLWPSSPRHPINDSIRVLHNRPFSEFAERIGGWITYATGIPFADQTGYHGKVTIRLSDKTIDPLNIDQLNTELLAYGLQLITSSALFDVLVIRKK